MSENVPRDLLNVIEPINYDLNYDDANRGRLIPYLMNRPDDWRCRLEDSEGNVLAAHLVWTKLDRHNVSMMLHGFEAQAKINIEKGKRLALEALHQNNKQLLGLK